MEIAPAMHSHFNSSSHDRHYYASVPSSPTRLTELYCEMDELLDSSHYKQNSCLATVPFIWEEKPGVSKTPDNNLLENDFSFDVSCPFSNDSSIPAEDLFHGGVIKTVHHPPHKLDRERGREKGFSSSRLPSSKSRRTRSLSPIGASNYRREKQISANVMPVSTRAHLPDNGTKRWSFKDMFLFRSASDGRASEKDPLKKYSTKNSCESGSVSKRGRRVSPHELHYNLNRVNLNEMKKKTFLPYKQGILGGLWFKR
uniref:uncharacterized protein LOC122608908 n=1 Tax=Erigeron canadensis TaxID=72917 RepID=UPI001CB8B74B|nr:uncharacterized protein LOC122608908 [Erigeron canadensis]